MSLESPIISRSSLYLERYGFIQRQNIALGLTLYLLGVLSIILVVGILWISTRPKAIYYIPSTSVSGIAYPDKVPVSSVAGFAQAWLLDWVNYTPETISGVYDRSGKFLSPEFLSQMRAGMDEELAKVSRAQVSSVFSMLGLPKVSEKGEGFEVVFTGVRVIFSGKEELSREDTEFYVSVRRAAATTVNPYGLVVFDFQKEKGIKSHD